ncbi:MAG: DUF882 domain-containing protein [Desulfocapsaceae bacterium]|jgi:uncharacterized protein YcbK (DUF882 family)|nr:DUF882 domain-containing protein [Desulfocapsaceae bacterium]
MSFHIKPGLLTRRECISAAAKIVAGLIVSSPLASLATPLNYHTLSFYHTHTGETLDLVFNLKTGKPEKVKRVTHFLRDFRTGDVHSIDPRLLDMLCRLQVECCSAGTFEVISGYRSPVTNEKLRKKTNGVAKKSLHMEGRAIDIRLSDIPTRNLGAKARSLKFGGVGYYAKSDFIHVDTGRVRSW